MVLNFSHVIFLYFCNILPLKVYEEIQFISNLIVQNIHCMKCWTMNAAGQEWRKEISSLFITQSMWKQNSNLLLCTLSLLLTPGQTHLAQETTGGRTLGASVGMSQVPTCFVSQATAHLWLLPTHWLLSDPCKKTRHHQEQLWGCHTLCKLCHLSHIPSSWRAELGHSLPETIRTNHLIRNV